MCPLVRHGIVSPPVEWSRRAQPEDPVTQREEDVDKAFDRMRDGLPYGYTALVRVNPGECSGIDIVPVVIARKAPIPWERGTFSSDGGMFEAGDVMVWIHDLPQTGRKGGRQFTVSPNVVSHENQRAIPLSTIAALGMPMAHYMKQSHKNPCRWTLNKSSITNARSNVVLLSVQPSRAFMNHPRAPLQGSDVERSPISTEGMFPVGASLERRIRAPAIYLGGRRRARGAWQGRKLFQGEIQSLSLDEASRRYSYNVKWEGGTPAERSMVDLQDVVDEGEIERFIVSPSR